MCTKVKFTKLEALTTLANMPKKQYRREIRAYHCPECNCWHLTSKEYEQYQTESVENELFKPYLNNEI
jgi:hypothetical protein